MPAITSGKVLVTGVNGFIAAWVAKDLLDKGYSVRGTVRSEAKGDHLRNVFATYGDRFELVVIEDFIKERAFDEAVKGVDAIEHVASPVNGVGADPNEQIKPAVEGTIGILRSAAKYGARVKRVVITSSLAVVVDFLSLHIPRVYSETDWNRKAIAEVESKGVDADAIEKYSASKALAELAAWDFIDEKKKEGGLTFDLVTIIPPFVFGPWLHEVRQPSSLNMPINFFWDYVIQGNANENILVKVGGHWVDVRDLASAHVLSLETQAAGGQRLLIRAGNMKWQDLVNVARQVSSKIPPGSVSYRTETAIHPIILDTSKTTKVLPQLEYRSLEDAVLGMLECTEKAGWWTR